MILSITPKIPSSLAIGLCLMLTGSVAQAQTTPTAPATPAASASSTTTPPADIAKTMEQLADLDLLTALTPLHMNTAQIDALVTSLEAIETSGLEVDKKNDESLRTIADDISTAHAASLKGTPTDSETRARIGKVLDEIDKRGRAAHDANVKKLVVVEEQNLTPEHIKVIETQYTTWIGGKIQLPAKYRDDPDGRKAYVEELALGEYTDRIVMSKRALSLLHKLRQTADAPAPPPTATVTTGTPATTPAATPPAAP